MRGLRHGVRASDAARHDRHHVPHEAPHGGLNLLRRQQSEVLQRHHVAHAHVTQSDELVGDRVDTTEQMNPVAHGVVIGRFPGIEARVDVEIEWVFRGRARRAVAVGDVGVKRDGKAVVGGGHAGIRAPTPEFLDDVGDVFKPVDGRVGNAQEVVPLLADEVRDLLAEDGNVDRNRLLDRLDVELHVAETVEWTIVAGALARPQLFHRRQRRVEALALLGGVDAVSLEFMREIAGADAIGQATAGQDIHHRVGFREHARIMKRQDRDRRAEAQAPGPLRDRRQHDRGIGDRAVFVEMMLGNPERVVGQGLRQLGLRDELRIKLRHRSRAGGIMILHGEDRDAHERTRRLE